MAWADATMHRAAAAVPAAASDQSLLEKIHHIHLVQRAFLHLWTRTPFCLPEVSTFENLAALESWGREYHAEVHSFVESIGEVGIEQPIPIPWAEEIMQTIGIDSIAGVSLGETMLQVVMHSTYHRGQVNMRLRQLGSVPPLTDFIAWLWMGKPAPSWIA